MPCLLSKTFILFIGKPRNRPKREGKRYSSETKELVIKQAMARGCCDKQCMNQINVYTVQQCRQEFFAKTNKEQSEFIIHQLR